MGSKHHEQQQKQHGKAGAINPRKMPPGIQGEGDYESARRFDREEQEFVASHDTGKLAREAAPKSKEEAAELAADEAEGRRHARGESLDDERMSGGTPARRPDQH